MYGEASWEKNGYGGANAVGGIIGCRIANIPQFYAESGGSTGAGQSATISINSTHGHTISVSPAGNNQLHENQQPYQAVSRWYRSA